jgi:hypothetical protein
MDMGRDGSGLASEIDALQEDEWLSDELERLKQSMTDQGSKEKS